LPDVGFSITHLGDAPYYVKASVKLDIYVNGTISNDTLNRKVGLYSGVTRWNLNPKEGVQGHFSISNDAACQNEIDLRVGINIILFDYYERPHQLLPVTYVYERQKNEWWLDPIDPVESFSVQQAHKSI
jgi:hypothetical protein